MAEEHGTEDTEAGHVIALLVCHKTVSLDRRDSTIISPQQSLVVAAILIDQRRTHVVYREHGCSA